MAYALMSHLQNLWPFSILKTNDLKVSTHLVHKLSIPEQTKLFVYALREPDSDGVVYILAAQNLSEQSAQDAECLIREVKPKAVVVQVALSALDEIKVEENLTAEEANSVPTSPFVVLKRCLLDKINKEQYDSFARCRVLREIFGIGFYGHFFSAKRAAEEVESHFVLLESPYVSGYAAHPSEKALQASHLVPWDIPPALSSSSRRFLPTDTAQSQMVKSLIPSLDFSLSKGSQSSDSASDLGSRSNYQAPPFAQSVYPLLEDLHGIFDSIPAIGRALVFAQKMLVDVNKGETIDTQTLSEVRNFKIAIEALRIGLNNAGRCPIDKMGNDISRSLDFSELPSEEKCHVLFAQSLRNQVRKFGSVVAVIDAGSLAGLRKHWNTPLPPEIADLADSCFTHEYDDIPKGNEEVVMGKKRLFSDKPVVAVGAGATAALGASSLSKVVPASTFIKLGSAYVQRTVTVGLGKILGTSKILVPKVASAGAKTAALKLSANAEKIHAVTHGMLASVQRSSLLAIRTSFYEIMRRRRAQPVRLAPFVTFGCSIATCTGLLVYGDGIECTVESFPSVPMITSLGRGLQSLHQASLEVEQLSGGNVRDALQSLMNNLRKNKVK